MRVLKAIDDTLADYDAFLVRVVEDQNESVNLPTGVLAPPGGWTGLLTSTFSPQTSRGTSTPVFLSCEAWTLQWSVPSRRRVPPD